MGSPNGSKTVDLNNLKVGRSAEYLGEVVIFFRAYVKPVAVPSGATWIRAAAGTLGRPGMVTISPQITTTKPAPALTRTSVTVMLKSRGRPSSFGLSDKDLGVFAMQTNNWP